MASPPTSLNGTDVDVDQDGDRWEDDPDEAALWKISQEAWVDSIRTAMPTDMPIIANGRAAWPDGTAATDDLKFRLNGAYLEGMGDPWWGTDRRTVMNYWFDEYQAGWPSYGHRPWDRPILMTDVRPANMAQNNFNREFARVFAIMFQCIYRHRARNSGSVWLAEDPTWDTYMGLLGSLEPQRIIRTMNGDGTITFTREFGTDPTTLKTATIKVDTVGNGGGLLEYTFA
jgi:hypothetical protein